VTAARCDLGKLDVAVREYRSRMEKLPIHNRNPKTWDVIIADVTKDKAGCYLDPWGTRYLFQEYPQWIRYVAAANTHEGPGIPYVIRCAGPDRKPQTTDDLTTEERR
jgi:hypothetical protein